MAMVTFHQWLSNKANKGQFRIQKLPDGTYELALLLPEPENEGGGMKGLTWEQLQQLQVVLNAFLKQPQQPQQPQQAAPQPAAATAQAPDAQPAPAGVAGMHRPESRPR